MDMLKNSLEIKVDKEGIPLDENPDRVLFEGGRYIFESGEEKQLESLC
ncbi:MAG: hypothetical protein MRQ13_05880 [Candidatus Midichloria sp.]|nr:hypothetical protein [Candidatus Midichloria sp.]